MPTDYPLMECAEAIDAILRKSPKTLVYQKYTCSGCGARLTMPEPNKLYMSGDCDKCPTITNIAAQGCNYMVVSSDPSIADLFVPK